MAGARIGRHCSLGQNVLIGGDAVIGDHVKIQNNVSTYDGVVLEEDVFCVCRASAIMGVNWDGSLMTLA
jgi:UDP-3-O-[3-hydroxymyristoyl] glucosamine N-acyltransferase